MFAPGWQTEDLVEEWVESSPSPPNTLHKPHPTSTTISAETATEVLTKQDINSIRTKRGSLRALGHAAPRALPPSRTASGNGTRVISGHGDGLSLTESQRGADEGGDGIPSPPDSRAGSDRETGTGIGNGIGSRSGSNKDTIAGKGTFVVKDGVEDDRGGALARNLPVKGRDMFGPSALEKMFQPPSPPMITPTAETNQTSQQPSSSEQLPSSEQNKPAQTTLPARIPSAGQINDTRRASHPYAPTNPSRLHKSVTPSTASSSSFSASASAQSEIIQSTRGQDLPPFLVDADRSASYPFTFHSPAHSTLRDHQTKSKLQPHQQTKARNLKLFRSTYDTYTREHLSALVDSIALEESPSPERNGQGNEDGNEDEGEGEGEWSASGSGSRSGSGSGSQSGSRSGSGSVESERRSSKRMRMSPSSPSRQGGIRDWGAAGIALMDRIRAGVGSETDASRSRSRVTESEERFEDGSGLRYRGSDLESSVHSAGDMRRQMDGPSISYPSLPPSPPLEPEPQTQVPRQADRLTHRSNPSTTSSGYLRKADELMTAIRARQVSESASSGRVVLSEVDEQEVWEEAERELKAKKGGKKAGPSPRRILRRLSASEEVRRVAEDSDGSPNPPRTSGRSSGMDSAPQPLLANGTTDDLNRVVSSTTFPISTTISTSFVKHPGPRAKANGNGTGKGKGKGIRMIKPDEVGSVIGEKVGDMRFNPKSMAWFREKRLRTVEEGRESRGSRSRSKSQESEDVFAGMESWGDGPGVGGAGTGVTGNGIVEGPERREARSSVRAEEDEFEEEEEGDERENDEENEDFGDEDNLDHHSTHSSPPSSPRPRPRPQHANAAPAILTPAQPTNASKPIRSALRNPNSLTPGPVKKRTGWHESVTPARSISVPRSVSFSDGKKSGKMIDLFEKEGEGEGKSWVVSARTKRIQGVLEDMEELSIEEPTPSKPPRPIYQSPTILEPTLTDIDIEGDRTYRAHQHPSHPRPRRDHDQTFLTGCSFGVQHDKLVQLITDVYGDEPWWEDLRFLDLRGKGVDGVGRLGEFVPGLEEVKLDNNKISYLTGIPPTVTSLSVGKNRLTSLTSVGHLMNLKVLDVSHNRLDSVTQLACLHHLKELKADSNQVRELDGIFGLQGLEKLSLRGNRITRVSFASAKWDKLESLDLAQNRIEEVLDLNRLKSLVSLNLDGNNLVSLRPSQTMASLRMLRLNDNDLTRLEISLFPKLRTLYADGNRLKGLERSTGSLESLSMRSQRVGGFRLGSKDLEGVKRLYMSGNRLQADFLPSTPLALTYLEAAACNLTSLPRDFATLVPDLEILNLNYNFLPDFNGLKGLPGLRKLSVVGNRLGGGGSKGVAAGLVGLTGLEELDLRMNPSTLPFYLPLIFPSESIATETEEQSPPRKTQFNTTAATIYPSSSVSTVSTAWAQLDIAFRKALPDEWYGKRLVYRGLVMGCCARLEVLDGVEVSLGERKKAGKLLSAAEVR